MHTVYFALGSNVGNKKENILRAIEQLRLSVSNVSIAPFYKTKPMYYLAQDSFLNTVVVGQTELLPEQLLEFIQSIEQSIGRIKRFQNGPREIDIDILFYDDLQLQTDTLQIPHLRIQERDFVLVPLFHLAPNLVHSVFGKTIAQLLEALPEESKSIYESPQS